MQSYMHKTSYFYLGNSIHNSENPNDDCKANHAIDYIITIERYMAQ